MAAVMSVSALGYCAAVKAPVGIVASASVTYSSEKKVPMPYVQALASYTDDEFKSIWNKGNAFIKLAPKLSDGSELYSWNGTKIEEETKWLGNWELGGYKYSSDGGETLIDIDKKDPLKYAGKTTREWTTGHATESSVPAVSIPFWYFNLKSYKSSGMYTYFGWAQTKAGEYDAENYKASKPKSEGVINENDSDVASKKRKHSDDYIIMERQGDKWQAAFQPVVYIANSDEEIMAALEAEAQRNAEKAEETKTANSMNNYVARKQGQWNGYDNVLNTNTGKKEGKTLFENSKGTAGVVYIPPEGNGHYTASDVKYLFDVCGVTDVEKAFLYDVNIPSPYELIEGKNMVVRLNLHGDNVTTGYNVYVYHIENGYAKRIRKVGWRNKYVVFAAKSFSPYVMVLTPVDQKRGVASTGAVLYANPPTGDGDVVPVALLAATALCTSCLLTVRKRREQEV